MPDIDNSLPHAIILGLSPTGLYAARELSHLGVPLLGVDREFTCGSLSRHFRYRNTIWHEPSLDDLMFRLIQVFSHSSHKPVLIPTSDYYIEFVTTNYQQLAKLFSIADCYKASAATLLNKFRFHELCTRHGIPTPGVWKLSDISDINSLIGEIPFPCILKPTLVHLARTFMHGKKVLIMRNREELISAVKELPPETGIWMIQEIIPGAESQITLAAGYAGGSFEKCDIFTARKLRQYPSGFGSASMVISEHCSETRDLTSQLIQSIGFQGVYGSEFKRDPRDGQLKIIEINPRPTLWFHLSHVAGKRLIERAYCDLTGLTPPIKVQQRDGVVWQYLIKDMASLSFYKFRGGKFVFPAPDLSAGGKKVQHCWPVFSISDPLPALAEIYIYVTKFVRRAF
jgi:predicted ATP-grasp superfamily ATP-dependent carboligase|tara:strand:+ start:6166 stop:7362 length:1197 start_codon:yes stop_codon:yes gene_type:complete